MRFLVDQDVYKLTVDKLKELGHDVVTVKELGMARASDEDLITVAREQNRILVTRDKDFGEFLFFKDKISAGVIFLRVTPGTLGAVHRQLDIIDSLSHSLIYSSTHLPIHPFTHSLIYSLTHLPIT
jgi:predicted nuclease of predicted toxin-antitoxin system